MRAEAVMREYSGKIDILTDMCMVKVNEGCSVVVCSVCDHCGSI